MVFVIYKLHEKEREVSSLIKKTSIITEQASATWILPGECTIKSDNDVGFQAFQWLEIHFPSNSRTLWGCSPPGHLLEIAFAWGCEGWEVRAPWACFLCPEGRRSCSFQANRCRWALRRQRSLRCWPLTVGKSTKKVGVGPHACHVLWEMMESGCVYHLGQDFEKILTWIFLFVCL